jgi:hypothetical protein
MLLLLCHPEGSKLASLGMTLGLAGRSIHHGRASSLVQSAVEVERRAARMGVEPNTLMRILVRRYLDDPLAG